MKINYKAIFNTFITSSNVLLDKYPHINLNERCRILFVEGSIDNLVYQKLQKTEENYSFRPIFTFEEFDSFLKRSSYACRNEEPYYAYQFVIDAANTVKNSYGIIDNDFDQHKLEKSKQNIGITETHDHETLLLLCYFDLYYKYLTNSLSIQEKAELEHDLENVFIFSVKQGLLEETSLSMSSSLANNELRLLSKISHSYFMDGCSDYENKHGKLIYKAVEQYYLSTFENDVDNAINEACKSVAEMALARKLKTKFEKKLQRKHILLDEINKGLIHCWLDGGYTNLSPVQKSKVHEICWYANGHVVISQLNDCIKRYVNTRDTNDEFARGMVHYLSNRPKIYCEFEPLKKWVRAR